VATIEKTREELKRLLREFDDEHDRARQPLVDALEKLGESNTTRRRSGKPKAIKGKASGASGRGRKRRGSATRRDQMLAILDENPGASSKAVAEKMGIASNYVYRLKGELESEDLVASEGRSLTLTQKGIDARAKEKGIGKGTATRRSRPKANSNSNSRAKSAAGKAGN